MRDPRGNTKTVNINYRNGNYGRTNNLKQPVKSVTILTNKDCINSGTTIQKPYILKYLQAK